MQHSRLQFSIMFYLFVLSARVSVMSLQLSDNLQLRESTE